MPLEKSILLAAAELVGRRPDGFYGLELVHELLGETTPARVRVVYRALQGLEEMRLLEAHWDWNAGDGFLPRRRYYTLAIPK